MCVWKLRRSGHELSEARDQTISRYPEQGPTNLAPGGRLLHPIHMFNPLTFCLRPLQQRRAVQPQPHLKDSIQTGQANGLGGATQRNEHITRSEWCSKPASMERRCQSGQQMAWGAAFADFISQPLGVGGQQLDSFRSATASVRVFLAKLFQADSCGEDQIDEELPQEMSGDRVQQSHRLPST